MCASTKVHVLFILFYYSLALSFRCHQPGVPWKHDAPTLFEAKTFFSLSLSLLPFSFNYYFLFHLYVIRPISPHSIPSPSSSFFTLFTDTLFIIVTTDTVRGHIVINTRRKVSERRKFYEEQKNYSKSPQSGPHGTGGKLCRYFHSVAHPLAEFRIPGVICGWCLQKKPSTRSASGYLGSLNVRRVALYNSKRVVENLIDSQTLRIRTGVETPTSHNILYPYPAKSNQHKYNILVLETTGFFFPWNR